MLKVMWVLKLHECADGVFVLHKYLLIKCTTIQLDYLGRCLHRLLYKADYKKDVSIGDTDAQLWMQSFYNFKSVYGLSSVSEWPNHYFD